MSKIVREEFSNRSEREAAEWCAVVFDAGASATELSSFSDWLAHAPQNEAAFRRLAEIYDQIGPSSVHTARDEYVVDASAFSTFDDFARIAASGETVERLNRAA